MTASWWRKLTGRAPVPEREWELRVDDVALAALRHPRLDDMFWVSLEIVPLTSPADPRLDDDEFWLDGGWTLLELGTGQVAKLAIASASGLQRREKRVLIRGLDAGG
jgi:hypothetical protein